ncbi:efflux RND transporter permease subunit [Bacteroidales bacterium OttesenSCG-928-L03]|nr:efflux RND transporter permease subunit [Bacteroidales bacterium OttesenSCG-928-L03]
MSLYSTAVNKPITTALIFVAVVIIGVFSYTRLPIDLFPDIEGNMITVITAYPGASASDIETNVTRPIENTLNSTENLKNIISQSKDNMSMVTLEFDYGIDLDEVTNDVRDKLEMVKSALPDEISNPIIVKFSADMMPVMIYSATATESVNSLYKILDDKVGNPLNRINGVGAVTIAGAPQREVQVNVFPERLESYNLTVEQIGNVITMENLNVPSGNFDIGSTTYSLRVEGEFNDSSQLLDIVVGSKEGRNIYLRDVAVVNDTIQSRVQESYTNGVKGATIVIQKQSGANTVEIAQQIQKVMPSLEETLPPDIKVSLVMDSSDFIERSIDSLVETILLALLFVAIVVLFFLGRWRATVIIIIAIPISLLVSFVYLMGIGGSLNIITLSSLTIAIGMVVDDAIVVLENITKHIERGSEPKQAAIHATNEVGVAIMASTLTIIAVFLPLTMTGGLAGVMFSQLGWMVVIMITTSLIVALTLTPMMCSKMLRLTNTQGKGFDRVYAPIKRGLDAVDRWYGRVVTICVRHRRKTLILSFALFFAIMIPALKLVKFDFMPAADNGSISLEVYTPAGTRMEVTRELAFRINNIIKENYGEEVEVTTFSVGQADENNTYAAMQTNGTNYVSMRMRLVDQSERDKSIYDIADELRKELENMPELYKYVVTPGGSAGMGTGSSTVDVEIYGYDLELTDRIAEALKTNLAEVNGLRDLTVSRQEYRQEYQVDFDRAKLAENGLNSATVATYIRNRFSGLQASKYREEGEEYDIIVRYDESYRQSLEDIENIIVYNNQGTPIRIKELGTVVEKSSLPQIDRKNRQRVNTVTGSIYGAALSDVIVGTDQVLAKLREDGTIPSEIGIKIGGSYEDQQETNSDLGLLMLLCVILVYIVIAAQFESLTYPFIIVFSIIFGFAGVMLALMITGQSLSLMAMVGLVMLIGIVVKNGIVLVDYINLNRERGMSIDKAVIDAGRSRLRPILMTTMTTILGMLPMAIPRGTGSEMWQPLGIAIVGGIALSTVLTLVYVPAFYSIFGANGVYFQRRKNRKLYKK